MMQMRFNSLTSLNRSWAARSIPTALLIAFIFSSIGCGSSNESPNESQLSHEFTVDSMNILWLLSPKISIKGSDTSISGTINAVFPSNPYEGFEINAWLRQSALEVYSNNKKIDSVGIVAPDCCDDIKLPGVSFPVVSDTTNRTISLRKNELMQKEWKIIFDRSQIAIPEVLIENSYSDTLAVISIRNCTYKGFYDLKFISTSGDSTNIGFIYTPTDSVAVHNFGFIPKSNGKPTSVKNGKVIIKTSFTGLPLIIDSIRIYEYHTSYRFE